MKWRVDNQERTQLAQAFRKLGLGQAIVLNKGSLYPYPFPVVFPELPHTELSEEQRQTLIRDFLPRLSTKLEMPNTDEADERIHEAASSKDLVEQLVRLCADEAYVWKPSQDKFLAINIRGKEQQESVLKNAMAQGLIKKDVKKVPTGTRGVQSILQVTEYACQKLGLKNPIKQNESVTAQYICHRIKDAIEAWSQDWVVEIQGSLG